ncbi:MAG: glycerol-3-phosphate acyltransferase [Ruminococcus sp.]
MEMFSTFLWITAIAGGYLLGSVHFCRIIPLAVFKKDICKISDDKNPGAANVFLKFGWKMGLLCLSLDIAKGFIPVFIAVKYLEYGGFLFTLAMLAPVTGHAFSVFYGFKGGKCIAGIFGEMIALLWISPVGLLLAGLYIFFSTAFKINPNRKRSILTFSIFSVSSLVLEIFLSQIYVGLGCMLVSFISIFKHLINKEDAC